MRHWTDFERGGLFWLALVDEVPEQGDPTTVWIGPHITLIREHPIPFTDPREAKRALARLNARQTVDPHLVDYTGNVHPA